MLQRQGPPFGVIARGLVGACCRGGDGGVEAGGGEGEGVEEVEDLNGGVGGGVGVDFDAVEGRVVGGEADAVRGGGDAGDAEVVVLHVGEGGGSDGAGEAVAGLRLGKEGGEVGEDGGSVRGDGGYGACEGGGCEGGCEGGGGGAGLGRGDAVWRVAW